MMNEVSNLFEKFYSCKYKRPFSVLKELSEEGVDVNYNTFSSGLVVGFLMFQFLIILTICLSYNIDIDFD